MKCDLCDETATIHITEITDHVERARHLCHEHGESQMASLRPTEQAGKVQLFQNGVAVASPQEATVQAILDNLRGTRNFLRDHGRMPKNVNELLLGMAAPDDGAAAAIDDATLQREFNRMDAQVKFIQLHRRTPATMEEFKSLGY